MTSDVNDSNLTAITEAVRAALTARTTARDAAIARSRELIRHCSESIRAVHRRDWDTAQTKLETVRQHAQQMRDGVAEFPELYHAGYTQDALKEVVEAFVTYAVVRGETLPTPSELAVEPNTYLRGIAEAATELRRFILDIMRLEDAHSDEAERLLGWMDAIYEELVTMDFPDAITDGLRRQTDVVRGVLERTRGDLTQSLRQQRLQDALAALEARLGSASTDTQ
jgi:translin